MELDPEIWTETLTSIVSGALELLPSLAGALALFIVGWLVARLVQFVLTRVFRRLGIDRVADKAGVSGFLEDTGLHRSASRNLARLMYWLVLLVFVLAAAESLGLAGVAQTLEAVLGYLPNVLAAALILLLGGLIARLVGDAVGGLAGRTGLATSGAIGQVVRYVLLTFSAILAVDQLQIETELLVNVVVLLVAASALALAIAVGFGSREIARNIMGGLHAKDAFRPGQMLSVRGYQGELLSIGSVKSVIQSPEGKISVPNRALAEEEVLVAGENVPAEPQTEAEPS